MFLFCPVFCYHVVSYYMQSSVIMIFFSMCDLLLSKCVVFCYHDVFYYVLSSLIMMFSIKFYILLLRYFYYVLSSVIIRCLLKMSYIMLLR